MSAVLFVPVVYMAAVLQIWLAPRWDAIGAGPDLLVLAAFWGMSMSGSRGGIIAAALAGLVSDLNSPGPMGVGMAAFAGAAFAAVWLRRQLNLDGPWAQISLLWLVAAGITLGQCGLVKFSGLASISWQSVVQRSLLVGLYTLIVALPFFILGAWRQGARVQFG